jgi:hypothetical protein
MQPLAVRMISIHQNEYRSAICSVRCPTDSKVSRPALGFVILVLPVPKLG